MPYELKSIETILKEICSASEEYVVYGHKLEDKDIILLTDAIKKNCSLKKLTITCCGLYGSKVVFKNFLNALPSTVVDLSFNSCMVMEDSSYIALIAWLTTNYHLKTLDLSSTLLTDSRCVELMNVLANHTSIKELNLFNNHIQKSIGAITSMLKQNTCLISLNLKSNHLTLEGINQIIDTIEQSNTSITKLSLAGNTLKVSLLNLDEAKNALKQVWENLKVVLKRNLALTKEQEENIENPIKEVSASLM